LNKAEANGDADDDWPAAEVAVNAAKPPPPLDEALKRKAKGDGTVL
jgi:hypothetical protein